MMMKTCTKCNEAKPLTEFHKQVGTEDGYRWQCKSCAATDNREYYRQNTSKLRAYQRERRAQDPDKARTNDYEYRTIYREKRNAYNRKYNAAHREQLKAYARKYNIEHADKRADYHLQHTYGISLAGYDKMLEAQGGGCAICGRTSKEEGRRLSIDHDHETGEIRGLLCRKCNTGLGSFHDDPLLTSRATEYLLRTKENRESTV